MALPSPNTAAAGYDGRRRKRKGASKVKNWYEFTSQAKEKRTRIFVYDDIGGGWNGEGVTAKGFLAELRDVPEDHVLDLHINSRGGSVTDGFAIYNALSARANDVHVNIDGIAASIASVIAMAGSKIKMPKTALMMIHDPMGVVEGRAADMRKMSKTLDKIAEQIAGVYAARTGRELDEIKTLMREETWMDGGDALAGKFVDELTDQEAVTNCFDLSVFDRAPGGSHQPRTPAEDEPSPVKNKQQRKSQIMETLLNALAEAEFVAAGVKDEAEAVRQFQRAWSKAQRGLKKTDALAKQVEDLSAENKSLREERAAILVDAAVRDGRLKKESRDAWIGIALADTANARKALDAMTPPDKSSDAVPAGGGTGKPILDEYRTMEPGPGRAKFRETHAVELQAAMS